MASSFSALLRSLAKRYPTARAFASALGIAPSQLTRSMRRGGMPFDINGCLRLARVTGVPADTVLRAAGKHVTADLIKEVYRLDPNAIAAATLSDEHRELLRTYDAVKSRQVQRAIVDILKMIDTLQGGMPDGISEGLDLLMQVKSSAPGAAPARPTRSNVPELAGSHASQTTVHSVRNARG